MVHAKGATCTNAHEKVLINVRLFCLLTLNQPSVVNRYYSGITHAPIICLRYELLPSSKDSDDSSDEYDRSVTEKLLKFREKFFLEEKYILECFHEGDFEIAVHQLTATKTCT